MLYIISLLVSLFLILVYFSLFRMSTNVINVLIVLIAFIPLVGPIVLIGWFAFSVGIACGKSKWEIECDINNNRTALFLQNNKLTHWLFNTSEPMIFWDKTTSEIINENGK